MKRLAVVLLVLSVLILSSNHVSKAAPKIQTTFTLTCNSITVNGLSNDGEDTDGNFVGIYDLVTFNYPVYSEIHAPYGEPFSQTFYFNSKSKYNVGDPISIFIVDYNGQKEYEAVIPPCSGNDCPIFEDGRLNDCDAGQTAAVYCTDNGSVKVLAIFDGKGYPAFTASPEEIAAVPTHPAKNTLIKSSNGAFLYRLTSGELQVNRRHDGTPAKDYSFRFTCN
jgi:hypothetical protein